jgi:type IV secretory pathway VirB10-like protein
MMIKLKMLGAAAAMSLALVACDNQANDRDQAAEESFNGMDAEESVLITVPGDISEPPEQQQAQEPSAMPPQPEQRQSMDKDTMEHPEQQPMDEDMMQHPDQQSAMDSPFDMASDDFDVDELTIIDLFSDNEADAS